MQEILNLIQGFVTAVLTLHDVSSCFLLSQSLLAEQSCSRLVFSYLLWLSGENEDHLQLDAARTMLR